MPTQICPSCSHSVPASAKYCLECATPMPHKYSSGTRAADQLAATLQNIRHMLFPCTIVALIVMTVTAGVLATRVRKDNSQISQLQAQASAAEQTTPNTNPIGTSAASATGNATQTNSGTVANTTPSANTSPNNSSSGTVVTAPAALPQDATDYLKYLQGIEARRLALQQSPLTNQEQAATTSGAPPPVSTGDDTVTKWQMLLRDFHTLTPPQSCTAIASDYSSLLDEEAMEVAKADTSASTANSVPALSPPVSKDLITMAQRVNDDITLLCSRYNAAKPVIVQVDPSTT
jgi:hypothetical protein